MKLNTKTAAVLGVTFAFCVALISFADTATVDGITWTYTVSNGKASLGGGSSSSTAVPSSTTGALAIPSKLGDYTVTCIGSYAFSGCSGLTNVTIPDSVTSIGWETFSGCSGLASVTIPDSVTSIGHYAFSGCSGLTNVTIPDSVTSIGDGAFSGCSGLTRVAIPDSVTSIGQSAFSGCSGLTSVTIPDGVTSIGWSAFSGCSASLFDTNTIAGVKLVDGWAIDYTYSLSGQLDLAGIRGIGSDAFYDCSGLTSVTIPDSVTSIGSSAFLGCSSLTGVTVPASVTSIGNWAFSYCSGLTGVTIPNSVTNIEERAFWNCSALTSVTIPASVTSIGSYAFYGCSGLTNVTFMGDAPVVGSSAFYSVASGCIASVSPKSTGWGVAAGEKWNGLALQHWPEVLPEAASDAEVGEIVATFADKALAEQIATVSEYDAFRSWVGDSNLYQPAVAANAHAAAAYLLGAERLFENKPTVEIGELEIADGDSAGAAEMIVSVTVRDGENPVKVAEGKVAAMFEATSDIGDWNGAAKLTPTVEVLDGDGTAMRFKVKPGNDTATSSFLRIRR